jgi:RNA polymerase sigma factor (sigma-70 family)
VTRPAREASTEDFDEGDFDAAYSEPSNGGYRSPLMSRLSGSGRLTLDLLRREVPAFQAGREATERLAASDVPAEDRPHLMRVRSEGEAAKERLLFAAIPLIKHLAQKEHVRRQNWQSQVTFDDLFQEGTIGLYQGLAKYDVNGAQTSPTNYLGQWVLTTMRRNAEAIDNDFGVAFDAAERYRRIRALRSRLQNELGRDPLDAEMIKAWEDPAYVGGRKIGRVKKTAPKPGKGLTEAQLAEEREMRSRVGHTARLAMSGTTEPDGPLVEYARPIGDQPALGDAADIIAERGAREGLARILGQTLDEMGLPALQREVIARRWGLPPHPSEQSARDISRALDLHRERVGRVIEGFTSEMSRPGGAFHRVCSALSDDELADLRLDWVLNTPTFRRPSDPSHLQRFCAPP